MKCWVCGNHDFIPVKGGIHIDLKPENFRITDAHYGITLPRYKCACCGFIQCDTTDVTSFYEQLEDAEYIDSSSQRALQFQKILNSIEPFLPEGGRLLDIGAGSGIFLREALIRGYEAKGIEPSAFLAEKAREDGLDIIQGTFPQNCPDERFDAIFLTDVIEHITDPLPMLEKLPEYLMPNGKVIVTTPDVSSMMAKVMGSHWWHYRIAHVGYYNRNTLEQIMSRGGMTPIKWSYAKWYFSSRYIMERLTKYLPFVMPLAKVAPERLMIPVNLFDSWLGIFEVRK